MQLVTSFTQFIQPLAAEFSRPGFAKLQILLVGWIFAGRRTVTAMLVAAGVAGQRHHSAFHRLFAKDHWSCDAVGLRIFKMIRQRLPDDQPIRLSLDDTLARKKGPKVYGAGMHHDPQLSSRSKTVTVWGHSWVTLCVLVRLPFCKQRTFSLPVLMRMYLNNNASKKARRAYRTRPELGVEMLGVLCERFPHQRFSVAADSAYGGQSVLLNLPDNCELTSRMGLNARLYGPVPPRKAGTNGRPRKRGDRLPSPDTMLNERAARRIELTIYGRKDRLRIVCAEARVYAAPDRPLRVVAVEALSGGRGREVFYSTDLSLTAEQVLEHYAQRWSIEVTFRDAKQSLGFDQPQGWSRQAARRTAPVALWLYTLIVLWFDAAGHRSYRQVRRPWYPQKSRASFADMLRTLRRESIRATLLPTPLSGAGSRKVMRIVDTTLGAAA